VDAVVVAAQEDVERAAIAVDRPGDQLLVRRLDAASVTRR
jgi:hypothetical protein